MRTDEVRLHHGRDGGVGEVASVVLVVEVVVLDEGERLLG